MLSDTYFKIEIFNAHKCDSTYPIIPNQQAQSNGVAHVLIPTCHEYGIRIRFNASSKVTHFKIVSAKVGNRKLVINNGQEIFYARDVVDLEGFETGTTETFCFISQTTEEKNDPKLKEEGANVTNIIRLELQPIIKIEKPKPKAVESFDFWQQSLGGKSKGGFGGSGHGDIEESSFSFGGSASRTTRSGSGDRGRGGDRDRDRSGYFGFGVQGDSGSNTGFSFGGGEPRTYGAASSFSFGAPAPASASTERDTLSLSLPTPASGSHPSFGSAAAVPPVRQQAQMQQQSVQSVQASSLKGGATVSSGRKHISDMNTVETDATFNPVGEASIFMVQLMTNENSVQLMKVNTSYYGIKHLMAEIETLKKNYVKQMEAYESTLADKVMQLTKARAHLDRVKSPMSKKSDPVQYLMQFE